MPGPSSSSCVPWSSTPPGAYRPSPISRCGRCCLQATQYLGHPETCSFRGYLPTAHSLACLRFAESVTVSGARLATGRAGSPFAGRVSHPLDDKQGFMKSSHTPFPLDQPCLVALSREVNAMAHISAREDERGGLEAVIRLPYLPAHGDATGRIPRGSRQVNAMERIPGSQVERDRAYLDAVERGAWETAHRIAHCGFPPNATVEELSVWGARRYRARVATNQPDPREYKGWDVCPASGKKDSMTHQEWRAHYDIRRGRDPRYDARKEWEVFKRVFKFLVVYPLSILGALGLFSGQKE